MRITRQKGNPLLASIPVTSVILGLLALTSPVACIVHAAEADSRLELVVPGKSQTFTLAELKAKLPVQTVKIEDPVYKKTKSFDGFWLADVIKLAGGDLTLSASADEIVFQAKDGYSPSVSFAKASQHRALLSFGEHGASAEQWENVQQGKAMVSPAPYYVVWTEGAKLADEVPWPYQLAKIELVRFEEKFPKVFPKGAPKGSAALRGFGVFKSQCLRCHSVNLEGGDLGPELNLPKNVTEYWSASNLRQFILDPQSFRLKSKMPSFLSLKSGEVPDVIAYLGYMKSRKLKP